MNITWNVKEYKDNFSFVSQYGQGVMDLIDKGSGGLAVDLGCGNGALTPELQKKGYRVLGVDASEEMLATARREHPDLQFIRADALTFSLAEKADVIFSNAVFHWIDAQKQETLAANIARQLKENGVLVCEFGGKGNGELVHGTLEKCFAERGLAYPRTFYFPSVGEYASLLEKHGFRVEYASLFDRPTVQVGEDGLINWINMFVHEPFKGMSDDLKTDILSETRSKLRSQLFVDGKWVIDYVRLRIKAVKLG